MKKQILLILVTIVGAFTATSQVTFDKHTDTLIIEDGIAHKAEITLTNNSGHDIELKWKKIFSTLHDVVPPATDNTNAWNLQFCECNTCYTNDFGALTTGGSCNSPLDTATGSNSQKWYLTADQNGQTYGNAVWVIEVTNLTDNIKDTLSYYVMNPDSSNDPHETPNSINDVTYNADVTSYPNPANNELIVDYTLTNVQAPVLSVYNLIGAKVASYTLNPVNGKLAINTSNLDNGMYFYTIEEQNQRVFIQKFNVVH